MGNRYLKADEREYILMLNGIVTYASDVLENKHVPKVLKTSWKFIRTHSIKIIKAMMEDLDNDALRQLDKKSKETVVLPMYVEKAIIKREKENKAFDTIPMKESEFVILANAAAASCCLCDFEGTDVDECPVRKLFVSHAVGAFVNHGYCPYRAE